jgi:hypothetical protein
MKRYIPLLMAAGLLVVMLVGFSPVTASASGPCLAPAAIAFSNSVMPAVVSAWPCPPNYKFDKKKNCCAKAGKCKCKKNTERWHQGKNRCVKR